MTRGVVPPSSPSESPRAGLPQGLSEWCTRLESNQRPLASEPMVEINNFLHINQ